MAARLDSVGAGAAANRPGKRESPEDAQRAEVAHLQQRRRRLKSVVIIDEAGQPHALLRVDSLLYQVKVGDYMGQNYGRIVKIGETELSLREVVQDAAGEWTERISTLQLQEKSR